MIEYELAKRLKDAGFPQGEPQVVYKGLTPSGNKLEPVYIPTLSELIAACGDDFGWLVKDNAGWTARGAPQKDKEIDEWRIGIGETMEEAVSLLWLDINRPKP